jgi:N-acetylneuraminic acid mutarotase
VMGGYNFDYSVRGTVYEYDPTTRAWAIKAPMPTPRIGGVAAVIGNKIHVIGGLSIQRVEDVHEVYDPVANTWQTGLAPLPQARAHAVAVVNGNKIHVFGGYYDYSFAALSTHYVYDATANAWTTAAPLPTARVDAAAALSQQRIYVMGGMDKTLNPTTFYAINEVYDIALNTWTTAAPLPAGGGAKAAVTLHGKIYVPGGGSTLEYDAGINLWRSLPAMAHPRIYAAVGVVNNEIHVIGGSTGAILSWHEAYVPAKLYYIHKKN